MKEKVISTEGDHLETVQSDIRRDRESRKSSEVDNPGVNLLGVYQEAKLSRSRGSRLHLRLDT